MIEYKIKKGKHYSNFTLNRLWPFANIREGELMIPSDDWYPKSTVQNHGWNKLIGLAQLFGIHTNSGRLVYKCDYNKVHNFTIAGYRYTKGLSWQTVEFASIKGDIWYPYKVEYENGQWVFMINGITIRMNGRAPWFTRKCYPYFGGGDKAYYTMKYYFR